eukprot:m.101264 g.101264  ORF g.101264 m.101264 type:complete len:677 (+) comp8782_c0_seq1:512-2542(+)
MALSRSEPAAAVLARSMPEFDEWLTDGPTSALQEIQALESNVMESQQRAMEHSRPVPSRCAAAASGDCPPLSWAPDPLFMDWPTSLAFQGADSNACSAQGLLKGLFDLSPPAAATAFDFKSHLDVSAQTHAAPPNDLLETAHSPQSNLFEAAVSAQPTDGLSAFSLGLSAVAPPLNGSAQMLSAPPINSAPNTSGWLEDIPDHVPDSPEGISLKDSLTEANDDPAFCSLGHKPTDTGHACPVPTWAGHSGPELRQQPPHSVVDAPHRVAAGHASYEVVPASTAPPTNDAPAEAATTAVEALSKSTLNKHARTAEVVAHLEVLHKLSKCTALAAFISTHVTKHIRINGYLPHAAGPRIWPINGASGPGVGLALSEELPGMSVGIDVLLARAMKSKSVLSRIGLAKLIPEPTDKDKNRCDKYTYITVVSVGALLRSFFDTPLLRSAIRTAAAVPGKLVGVLHAMEALINDTFHAHLKLAPRNGTSYLPDRFVFHDPAGAMASLRAVCGAFDPAPATPALPGTSASDSAPPVTSLPGIRASGSVTASPALVAHATASPLAMSPTLLVNVPASLTASPPFAAVCASAPTPGSSAGRKRRHETDVESDAPFQGPKHSRATKFPDDDASPAFDCPASLTPPLPMLLQQHELLASSPQPYRLPLGSMQPAQAPDGQHAWSHSA